MANTPTIEEVMKRVSELEGQLAELNKAISTHSMTVNGNATVESELAAGSIREGSRALAEKYQAKGESVVTPGLLVTADAVVTSNLAVGSVTVDGELAAKSIKEGIPALALSEKYQAKGDYLPAPGGVVKRALKLDISNRTGSAGRDILYLKGDPNQNDAVIILQSSDQLTIWDHRPGRDQIAFLKVAGVRQPSDARLKHNVLPLKNVLDRLRAVRGVSFEWNELYDPTGHTAGQKQIGVIAQEVEAAFPDLACDDSDRDFKTLDYSRLVPILIEGLKELRQEKDGQIAALRNQLTLLRQQIQSQQVAVSPVIG